MASHSTVDVKVTNVDSRTIGDSFSQMTFDVADFKAFEAKSPQLGATLFTHVFAERLFSANNPGAGFQSSHAAALGPEAAVMGAATRTESGTQLMNGWTGATFD